MPTTTTSGVSVHPLGSAEERAAAIALYRRVFLLADDEPAVNVRLLVTLPLNGGSVLGAFTDVRTGPDPAVYRLARSAR